MSQQKKKRKERFGEKMIELKWLNGNDMLSDCFFVRKKVFILEQGFCEANEFDETDKAALHLLATQGGVPAGTLRLFKEEGSFHVGRICVLKEFRGSGLGAVLLKAAEEKTREAGGKELVLSAQVRVSGFYEKLGYQKEGKEYLDEFCPHIKMKKLL